MNCPEGAREAAPGCAPPALGGFCSFVGRGLPDARLFSFRRDISPPAGGDLLFPWRKRRQNATGDGSDEHFVLIVAFPRTPLRGTRTC